jgi:hypothetical protein
VCSAEMTGTANRVQCTRHGDKTPCAMTLNNCTRFQGHTTASRSRLARQGRLGGGLRSASCYSSYRKRLVAGASRAWWRARCTRPFIKSPSSCRATKENLLSGRNWDRPSFKTRGRRTENISGADVPEEFRTTPRLPRPKADQRREAEAALREFMSKKPAHQQPLAKVNILPIDDDDVPF